MSNTDPKIILLSSPFQLKQLQAVSQVFESNGEIRIAFSSFVSEVKVKQTFLKAKLYPFHADDLRLDHLRFFQRITDLVCNPIKTSLYYRNIVKRNKSFVKVLTAGCDTSKPLHVIIFNDRDLLTQILLKYVKRWQQHVKVTAIDEGLGYYIKEGFREKAKKVVYKLVTPLLFGFDYLFMEQYGTHPMIQEVYLRFPGQLANRKNHVQYKTISSGPTDQRIVNLTTRPTLLFFSTLFSEENHLSEGAEREMYAFFSSELLKHNFSLVWKPHPRESATKIEVLENFLTERLGQKFYRIAAETDIESLDVFSFDCVINIGSTVMLYILESGFPPDKVVNFKLYNYDLQMVSKVRSFNFYKYKEVLPTILHGIKESSTI